MSQRSLSSKAVPFLWAAALLVLSACMSEQTTDIPANAMVATSGNDVLSYTVPSSGMIWVFDTNHDRMLYSGAVLANDTITVDPGTNVIAVSGRTVADKIMSKGDKHRIYYQPAVNSADHHPM